MQVKSRRKGNTGRFSKPRKENTEKETTNNNPFHILEESDSRKEPRLSNRKLRREKLEVEMRRRDKLRQWMKMVWEKWSWMRLFWMRSRRNVIRKVRGMYLEENWNFARNKSLKPKLTNNRG